MPKAPWIFLTPQAQDIFDFFSVRAFLHFGQIFKSISSPHPPVTLPPISLINIAPKTSQSVVSGGGILSEYFWREIPLTFWTFMSSNHWCFMNFFNGFWYIFEIWTFMSGNIFKNITHNFRKIFGNVPNVSKATKTIIIVLYNFQITISINVRPTFPLKLQKQPIFPKRLPVQNFWSHRRRRFGVLCSQKP